MSLVPSDTSYFIWSSEGKTVTLGTTCYFVVVVFFKMAEVKGKEQSKLVVVNGFKHGHLLKNFLWLFHIFLLHFFPCQTTASSYDQVRIYAGKINFF